MIMFCGLIIALRDVSREGGIQIKYHFAAICTLMVVFTSYGVFAEGAAAAASCRKPSWRNHICLLSGLFYR